MCARTFGGHEVRSDSRPARAAGEATGPGGLAEASPGVAGWGRDVPDVPQLRGEMAAARAVGGGGSHAGKNRDGAVCGGAAGERASQPPSRQPLVTAQRQRIRAPAPVEQAPWCTPLTRFSPLCLLRAHKRSALHPSHGEQLRHRSRSAGIVGGRDS